MKITVTKGNAYDSRLGGRTYAMWTTGHDYEVSVDGIHYGFQRHNYDRDVVCYIDTPVVFEGQTEEIAWEETPKAVRNALFEVLFPDGTEVEMNLFVYGPIDGAKKNRVNEWADTHQVHSRKITLQLRKELGEFTNVEFIREYSRSVGTGYRNKVYHVDSQWEVTVRLNCYSCGSFYDDYTVRNLREVEASRKAFGQRVARLAKMAGVPCGLARLVTHLSDDEAVEVLKAVKAAKGTASEQISYELSCGISRRTAALEMILGETFFKMSCSGQSSTKYLAGYLMDD